MEAQRSRHTQEANEDYRTGDAERKLAGHAVNSSLNEQAEKTDELLAEIDETLAETLGDYETSAQDFVSSFRQLNGQ